MSLNVLSVIVGGAVRTGGPPAFVGQAALQMPAFGGTMKILATDLALAPTGWWQRQHRIQPDELHPELARADVTLCPARFPRRLAFSPALSRRLDEVLPGCRVLHIHNLWQYPQYAAYRAAQERRIPYVVSPHGSLDPYLRRHGRVRKRLASLLWQQNMLDNAVMLHVTTRAEEELIADIAPHVPRRVVPCGIHAHQFTELPPREQFRDRYLAGYDGPLIMFLSRLTYKKGLDALVRAFAHARRELECRLAVVGPDDEGLQPSLARLAEELGVGREVVFAGPVYREGRLAALASCDVWALSSYTENFGIAVVEAMAAGCAVAVSSSVNLAPEIAAANAGVVAGLSPDQFGEALLEILANDRRRAELQARARPFAERYDWRAVAPEMVEMYREAARVDF
jgi:glycosyltransferase involved in cell wall biosynthesis